MALKERCTSLLVTAIISVLALVHTVVSQDQCSRHSLLATDRPKYITSPNYPSFYMPSADCRWNITAASSSQVVILYVLDLFLEGPVPSCQYDYVNILNGTGLNLFLDRKLCDQIYNTRQFMSTGPSMEVVFRTDGSRNYRGFKIEYTSSVATSQCYNDSLLATGTPRYLTSPNYPSNYSSLTDCQWLITAVSPSSVVVLKVLGLYVDGSPPSCTEDNMIIYDGSSTSSPQIEEQCGKMLITHQFVSTGPNMTVLFHSNGSVQYRGFVFEYTSKDKTAKFNNGTFQAYATSQYISSPNYPFNYSSNTDCQWLIIAASANDAVVIKLLDFYVEVSSPSCSNDYVSIHNGSDPGSPIIQKLCGQVFTDQQFISNGSSMTVVFHSDASSNYRGFKLEYFSQKNPDQCKNETLLAFDYSRYLTSPNYPLDYPSNMNCQWSIKAASSSQMVLLKVLNFTLERSLSSCNKDYVAIYDGNSTGSPILGTLCGYVSRKTIISTGSYMTVLFHSDETRVYSGFKFQFFSMDKTASCTATILTANRTVNYLTPSDYYSRYLSDIFCQWSITADSYRSLIVLELTRLRFEDYQQRCISDCVSIYDGHSTDSIPMTIPCGSRNYRSFVSTSSDMTVVYHSVGENCTDVSFTYQTQELQITRHSDEENTNIEIADTQYTCFTSIFVKCIASGVGCSLIVTFLASINLLCFYRRKQTQLKNDQKQKTAPDVRNNPLFVAGVGSDNREVPPIEELQDWQEKADESLNLNPNLNANSSLVSAPPVNKPQPSSLPGGKFDYTHGHEAQSDDLYECIPADATPTRQAKLLPKSMHAGQRPNSVA